MDTKLIPSFTYSVSHLSFQWTDILNVKYVPSSVLGYRLEKVKEGYESPSPQGSHSLMGEGGYTICVN